MSKPKRPSTLKKATPPKESEELPSHQNRRTLAEHVKDNMLCAGKTSYHQRILFSASHSDCSASGIDELRRRLFALCKETNQEAPENEKITGFIFIYATHSVYMVEGSETFIAQFMEKLSDQMKGFYSASRLSLILNNSNQVHTR